MKENRFSLAAGFMPSLCLALLLGFEYLLGSGIIADRTYVVVLAEVLAFAVPTLALYGMGKIMQQPVKPRLRGFYRKALPFVLFLSITASLLSFLINCLTSVLLDQSFYQQTQYVESLSGDVSVWALLLVVVLLPAVLEEIFFRGMLQESFAENGTYAAIFIGALAFALIHGNLSNLLGPLAAGMIYGYMTYVLDSVWPAIIAHVINNLYFLLMNYATRAYETLGFWPYFILASFFVFCIFLYLSMRSLEKLIERGKIRRFRRYGFKQAVSGICFTPGIWLLIIMFVIKVLYL